MKKITISLKLCTLIFCGFLSYSMFSHTSPATDTTTNTFTVPAGSTKPNVQWGTGRDASSGLDEYLALADIDNDSANNVGIFTSTVASPEIDVTGVGNFIIGDGTNTPNLSDNTDFGKVQIVSETVTKIFVIINNGDTDLTIGAISLSGTTDFMIDSKPVSGTVIAPGNTENITISFTTTTQGIQNTKLTIASDDADESNYQINITAEGDKIFFDSDGDGVYDDVDIDDDNDGIIDSDEESSCRLSNGGSQADYKFLNETFGTAGDADSKMSIINADVDSGIFYETQITGTLANVPVTYSFRVIDNDNSRFSSEELPRNKPNITVNFLTLNKSTTIASFDTGDITRCPGAINDPNDQAYNPSDPAFNTCTNSEWKHFTQQFTTSETAFIVQFVKNTSGDARNDLAIDDIEVRQTLCDTDSDGIADIFDLDSDNDGIPDVVEGNPSSANLSEGKASLTNVSTWIDINGNGMHDLVEGISPVNSDNDTIHDYLDLDSDNDGLFDVDESGAINTNDVTFQNGDGDINGDGVGDGPETETFREKDSNGDGSIEGYGDGILDIYDFHEGNTTYTNSYGNTSQGSAPLYALDSDSDGIPDYKDPYNNLTFTYDIDTVEIYASLSNTAGVLDSTTDADGDGIMASRDGDDTVFGSPRNLDNSYSLYFDGRNDYVEDTNVIASGDATLMAFIKPSGANTDTNDRIVAGQSDFLIRVNDANNTVTAISEGITLTSTTIIPDGIWTHIALTTEDSGDVVLYINGVEEVRNTSSSGGITDASNFIIGRATSSSNYFKGEIDEVRIFDIALTSDELKKMVYQELDDANSFNSGKTISLDISASIGGNLIKYYKMDGYDDDILDDKTSVSKDVTGAKMYNFKDIYYQRAPLPYETIGDGDWTDSANWLYGSEWDITTKQNNPDDASIVHIKNNIDLDGTYNIQGMIGLIVDNAREFTIKTNKGLYNSWYLEINGLLNLEGESQLIQTENSILEPTSSGSLKRDQQGTSSIYTYNHWASPVGQTNSTSNNNNYTLPEIISNVGFLTSGYNGSASPVKNADYWIWKYSNLPYDNCSAWQHIRSTGNMLAGEGFTMKGPGTTGSEQNYVFNGKPNNGDITLPIITGNEYLIGNPYASAIDADKFIKDNIKYEGNNTDNIINGALYFWEHFSNNTHVLKEYEGGYGIYTLMGSTEAISNDVKIKSSGSLKSTKGAPGRYIPVGQGFFITAITAPTLDNEPNDPELTTPLIGGNIVFKNSQRVFATEASASSTFLKSSNVKNKATVLQTEEIDNRRKIRLKIDTPNGYHRQILVGEDENASNNFDNGYDAPLIEDNKEDMFWVFNDSNFIIQAVNNFNQNQKLPIGIKINKAGLATIKIDSLENIENNQQIYLHDKASGIYHSLKESDYQVVLAAGKHTDRFEIAFATTASKSLGVDDIEASKMQVYYSNETTSIILHNPNLKDIKSTEIFNTLGQSVYKFDNIKTKKLLEFKTKSLNANAYIINIKTIDGNTISKKVLIK